MNEATAMSVESIDADQDHRIAVRPTAFSPEQLRQQIAIEKEMRSVLRDYVKAELKAGHHYAENLGSQKLDKPMLLQEGTRNICSLFKLTFGQPVIDEKFLDDEHYRVRTYIELFNASGERVSTGTGICSTRESKYAYRKAERVCPSCGQPAIIKDNYSKTGGWLCYAKKGGCGEKFDAKDEAITSQILGRVENPDIADVENTVLKMSIKRAKTHAACDVPLVSELFVPSDDEHEPAPRQHAAPARNSRPAQRQQQAPPAEAPAASVAKAVELAGKLRSLGVEEEDLVLLLPEGIARFEDLSPEVASGVVPTLVELINSKIAANK
jgi:hypothetical protein